MLLKRARSCLPVCRLTAAVTVNVARRPQSGYSSQWRLCRENLHRHPFGPVRWIGWCSFTATGHMFMSVFWGGGTHEWLQPGPARRGPFESRSWFVCFQPPRLEREDYNKLFVVFLVDVWGSVWSTTGAAAARTIGSTEVSWYTCTCLHPIVAQHRSKFSQLAAGLLTLQYARRGNVERYTADTTTAVSATVVCVYDSNLAHTRAIDWANARWSTQSVRTLQ